MRNEMMKEALPRVVPFAVFMAFIGLEEGLRYAVKKGFLHLTPEQFLYLYPLKVVTVLLVIGFFWKKYDEINFRDFLSLPKTAATVAAGIVVFILWINMDWTVGGMESPGYNPLLLPERTRIASIAFRLFGAAVVVPIIEELFWRSFLIRYLIDDIRRVPIGQFTWGSFLISSILFGLEHHYVFAGIMAGVAYNLLLYYTRSISHCIIAHAITNLVLGIYVLQTGEWRFW